jgi:hypothetical protein
LQSWDEQPALHGDNQIDTRTSNGKWGDGPDSWGETTSSSFIEHVTDWDPEHVISGFKEKRRSCLS